MNIIDNTHEHRNAEEFYSSLKEKLEENHQFPEEYLFKFIFPNDNEKLSGFIGFLMGYNTPSIPEKVPTESTSLQAYKSS